MINPGESDEAGAKGYELLRNGDYQAADEQFRSALRLDNDNMDALRGIAHVQKELKPRFLSIAMSRLVREDLHHPGTQQLLTEMNIAEIKSLAKSFQHSEVSEDLRHSLQQHAKNCTDSTPSDIREIEEFLAPKVVPPPPSLQERSVEDAKKLLQYYSSGSFDRKNLQKRLQELNDERSCRRVLEIHLQFYLNKTYDWGGDSGYEPSGAFEGVGRQLETLYRNAKTPAWRKVFKEPFLAIPDNFPFPEF